MELVRETQALVAGHGQLHQLANRQQRVAKLTPQISVWN
jgi:hypothetical protein